MWGCSVLILAVCLAARGCLCTLHFNRTIASGSPGHALFASMGRARGISMAQCAARAAETWDADGATQAANAFKYRASSASCDFGKVPKASSVEDITVDDEEGIYVIQECMESEARYEDVFFISRRIEGEMDKFTDGTLEELTETEKPYDHAKRKVGCQLGTGEVKFGNLRSHYGMCSGKANVKTHDFTDATLMVWIHTTSAEKAGFDKVLYVSNRNSWNSGFHFGLNQGRPHLSVWKGNNKREHHAASTGPLLEHGKWNHVAATWQGTQGLAKFYVNGEPYGEEVAVGPVGLMNPLGRFSVKACVIANPCHVTDVRVYTTAKGDADMRALYEDAGPAADGCPMVTHAAPVAVPPA